MFKRNERHPRVANQATRASMLFVVLAGLVFGHSAVLSSWAQSSTQEVCLLGRCKQVPIELMEQAIHNFVELREEYSLSRNFLIDSDGELTNAGNNFDQFRVRLYAWGPEIDVSDDAAWLRSNLAVSGLSLNERSQLGKDNVLFPRWTSNHGQSFAFDQENYNLTGTCSYQNRVNNTIVYFGGCGLRFRHPSTGLAGLISIRFAEEIQNFSLDMSFIDQLASDVSKFQDR